jgi:hypothetical protein
MVCPKFNSHVYKMKRWVIGEHICFYVMTWGPKPKKCFYWKVPIVHNKISDGPMNVASSLPKKKSEKEKTM